MKFSCPLDISIDVSRPVDVLMLQVHPRVCKYIMYMQIKGSGPVVCYKSTRTQMIRLAAQVPLNHIA